MFKKEHFKVILPCYRVSASHFKLKLQDDLLTRPVQQLMGYALDDPEDVSGLPDNVTFGELQRRMLCTVCDHRGADVGPSWLHHG